MSGQHARFAPSSAERVVTCPASFLFTQGMESAPSVFAVHGTVAHYIHEQCITHGIIKASQFVGMHPVQFLPRNGLDEAEWDLIPFSRGLSPDTDFIWTQAMADAVQESVDYCTGLGGVQFVEQRLSISNWTPIPDQFGTSDFIAITDSGVLWCVDLKFGEGVKVYAERNYQAVLYALGAIDQYSFLYEVKQVNIVISQPRLGHLDVWETTPNEVFEIGAHIKERFTLALRPDAPFAPSEKACKFCPGKAVCPALAQRSLEVVKGMFDDLNAPIEAPSADQTWPLSTCDAKRISAEQLAMVLDNKKMLIDFLEAAESHATHLLLSGESVRGWKLVEGRSNRAVRDPLGFEGYLRAHGVAPYRERLITLAEAEKALPKNERGALSEFTVKPPGRPTLAPESDKRKPMQTPSALMFDRLGGVDVDVTLKPHEGKR